MPRNDLKAYTSVIARIPQDLADQVKRYAKEHRCAVSELIRDGLEMRLEADLPWHTPGRSRDADGEVVPFDTTKYRLSTLCKAGHDYHHTGKSLRANNKAGYCLACHAAAKQREREQKRQQEVRA